MASGTIAVVYDAAAKGGLWDVFPRMAVQSEPIQGMTPDSENACTVNALLRNTPIQDVTDLAAVLAETFGENAPAVQRGKVGSVDPGLGGPGSRFADEFRNRKHVVDAEDAALRKDFVYLYNFSRKPLVVRNAGRPLILQTGEYAILQDGQYIGGNAA